MKHAIEELRRQHETDSRSQQAGISVGTLRDLLDLIEDRPYALGSKRFPGLSKLTEEVGELGQILGKILGCGSLDHWDGDLTPRLLDELGDVRAAIEVFMDLNLDWDQRFTVSVREAQKKALFMEWHDAGDPPPAEIADDHAAAAPCPYCRRPAHEGSCHRDLVGGAGPPCLVCGVNVHLDPDGNVHGHEAMGSADAHHAATLGDAP